MDRIPAVFLERTVVRAPVVFLEPDAFRAPTVLRDSVAARVPALPRDVVVPLDAVVPVDTLEPRAVDGLETLRAADRDSVDVARCVVDRVGAERTGLAFLVVARVDVWAEDAFGAVALDDDRAEDSFDAVARDDDRTEDDFAAVARDDASRARLCAFAAFCLAVAVLDFRDSTFDDLAWLEPVPDLELER